MQCLREVLHAPVQTPHSWARRGGPWCTLHGRRVPPSAGAWSPPCPASSLTPASGVVKLASLSYNDNRFYVMFIVLNKYNWKWQIVKYLREKKLSEKSIWEFIMVEKRMPRAWCKTIVTPYIKWGSYNSFAPSPRCSYIKSGLI